MKMTKSIMMEMGYMQDGDLWNRLWISPTTGECLSFEQARQEAEQERAKLIHRIAGSVDGDVGNGHNS